MFTPASYKTSPAPVNQETQVRFQFGGSYPFRPAQKLSPKTKSDKTAIHALKAVGSLPHYPFEDPCIVIAKSQVVIQGREAMRLA